MKKIALSALLTMCLVSASYANSLHLEPMVNQSSCGQYYHEVLQHPLTTRDAPKVMDDSAIRDIQLMKALADKHIVGSNISDYPKQISMREAGINSDETSSVIASDATVLTLILASHYFNGKYVPKDDYQAIIYLKQAMKLFRQGSPDTASSNVLSAINYLGTGNDEDEIAENNDFQYPYKLLVQAGSIEAEALLITEFVNSEDSNCISSLLPRLEQLGEQGSRIAIHKLADTYQRLDGQVSKANYWGKKSLEYPLTNLHLGL